MVFDSRNHCTQHDVLRPRFHTNAQKLLGRDFREHRHRGVYVRWPSVARGRPASKAYRTLGSPPRRKPYPKGYPKPSLWTPQTSHSMQTQNLTQNRPTNFIRDLKTMCSREFVGRFWVWFWVRYWARVCETAWDGAKEQLDNRVSANTCAV
jgi:hypothetical protein